MVDKPYCKSCGADYNSISWDATAMWDPKVEGDGLFLVDVMDQSYCEVCGDTVKIEWREEKEDD